ncbi:MAG TPA: glycosyltransferase family 4 protein [Anaerolineae bacterium]|nr:glycosyltransferase family 4 protein [Caldilineae bacterium]HID33164.1 glycosyltransferase family 4 protein [Anaerolineae bacterium]
MRVVMISKACIVGAYQKKLEALAREPDIQLTVLTPPSWKDDRGEQPLERAFTQGYELRVTPIRFNGHFHFHHYPRLAAELDELQPDLLHIDEEPYNLATRKAMGLAVKRRIPALFFTWQNIHRRYPFPFGGWERYNYRHARWAIAGNHDAAAVLRAKGYAGPIAVIPQFGVDPELFAPSDDPRPDRPFTIGYAGGLVQAKGVDVLLRACARLPKPWELRLAGTGPEEARLRDLAQTLGIREQVRWLGKLPSLAMPDFLRDLDALALPSRTTPNWKEQFGRVLVEAMACETSVIGSDSGEIPHVIGEAGLIFPEDDVDALAAHLRRLQSDETLRQALGQRGRRRVLARFTQAQIAQATAAVYRQILDAAGR